MNNKNIVGGKQGKSQYYSTHHKSRNNCVIFPSPMLIWVCSHFSAPKYARLNIGEGEGHIWVRTKVWRVNVRNLEKIQDKWLLFQRFVTSIVGLICLTWEWILPTKHGPDCAGWVCLVPWKPEMLQAALYAGNFSLCWSWSQDHNQKHSA